MEDELRWYLLRKKRTEELLLNSFRAFRRAGIEPILIKGWAAARNYPEDMPRFYGDIDLAVSSTDFQKATELMDAPDTEILGVDLHRELRHLDTLDWTTLMSNSKLVELESDQIRVLAPEDHLRVLCAHWLTNGGEDRQRLWDIYYAVRNRPADFDWDKCLNVVSPNRRTWVVSTIGLAHKYLDLDIDDLPFANEIRRLPKWLTRSVEKEWSRGVELRSLHVSLRSLRAFMRQLRKRIPPNPVQATVDCEAAFDEKSRVPYQIKDVVLRLGPSLKRLLPAVVNRESR